MNLYAYVGNDPVNLIDPEGQLGIGLGVGAGFGTIGAASGAAASSAPEIVLGANNYNFLLDFLLGRGERIRNYGSCSRETTEMAASSGANALKGAFTKKGTLTDFEYTTGRAYRETIGDPQSIAFQVGGFTGTATDNLDGTVTYTIYNPAGTHSFFYHLVPDRKGTTGPMRTIHQTFTWTEPIK